MELSQVLEFMGFKEAPADFDAFKAQFGEQYIGKQIAAKDPEIRSKVAGEVLGSATTAAKRLFSLEPDEIKDKKLEDVLALAAEKAAAEKEALKAAGSKGDDEKIKAAQEKAEAAERRAKEEEGLRKSIAEQLAEKEKNFQSEIKAFKVNSKLSEVYAKLPWAQNSPVIEVAKEGFQSKLQKNYIFDADEQGNVIVTDKEGNRIPNESKNNFLTPEEVIRMEAEKSALLAKSNGKPDDKKEKFKANQGEGQKKVYIHPNAQRAQG